ncbi:hypothetical protein GA0061071_10953 [Kosakonia oryzendophytica]|uniref:Uncharacterized protein n=1 Tax=Kosakonia oryzendophytica TaxID=1005665 RepID=A0A1C4CWE0_9ENTR|nr:hypothetical protein DFO53_1373 [Enterobacter sp. AG5470]SCC23406.1 hypothetical protein GA0061071_10953 [Kosakonia oryzendophytica]
MKSLKAEANCLLNNKVRKRPGSLRKHHVLDFTLLAFPSLHHYVNRVLTCITPVTWKMQRFYRCVDLNSVLQ